MKKVTNKFLLELFTRRYLETKDTYDKMVANNHPYRILTKSVMELNERLMKQTKQNK